MRLYQHLHFRNDKAKTEMLNILPKIPSQDSTVSSFKLKEKYKGFHLLPGCYITQAFLNNKI